MTRASWRPAWTPSRWRHAVLNVRFQDRLAACAAGLVALYLINSGLIAIVTYWGHVLGIALETEMRRRAFDHLQRLSFSFYDEQRTGHLIARVTKDLEDIGEVAHHGPEDLFI